MSLRFLGFCLAVFMTLGAVTKMRQTTQRMNLRQDTNAIAAASGPKPVNSWRRTVNGWEDSRTWQLKRDQTANEGGLTNIHPTVIAGLLLTTSLLALSVGAYRRNAES